MRYRVANKRRLAIWCIVFVLMILNLIFAVSRRLGGTQETKGTVNITSNSKALTAAKDGSIVLDENKYFKRFIISCTKELNSENIDYIDNNGFINIHFRKDDLSNVTIKSDKNKIESNDIYYENTKDDLVIKIKKKYNENNSVQVSSGDNKKIIVLIAKLEDPFHHSVVLDAGHGGVDKGTNYEGIYEKDINLKILKYASEELTYYGFKVTKTRNEDKFLELGDIGKIVNAAKADVFISVHINDFKESKYNGVSTYYYDPFSFQKEERIRLANTMQKELLNSDNWFDRGIFKENLQVLRDSKIPCVLLECGFLTNPEDREKLTSDEVLKNFGVNITKGLLNYFAVTEN